MVEALKRLREPAAIVVLVVTGLQILFAFITLGTDGGVYSARSALVQPGTTLILALIVGVCVLWERTPRARLLALLALISIGVQVVFGFLFTVVSLVSAGPALGLISLVSSLGTLAVVAVIGFAILTMYRGLPAPVRAAAGHSEIRHHRVTGGDSSVPPAGNHPQPPAPGYGPPAQPWQPDPSAGQSWRTAGEAASGASASEWSSSGPGQGWRPAPPSAPPSAPAASGRSAAAAPGGPAAAAAPSPYAPPAPTGPAPTGPAPTGPTATDGPAPTTTGPRASDNTAESRVVPSSTDQPDQTRAKPARHSAEPPQWWDQT